MCSARFDAFLLGPGRTSVSCPTFKRHGKPWGSVRFSSLRSFWSPGALENDTGGELLGYATKSVKMCVCVCVYHSKGRTLKLQGCIYLMIQKPYFSADIWNFRGVSNDPKSSSSQKLLSTTGPNDSDLRLVFSRGTFRLVSCSFLRLFSL